MTNSSVSFQGFTYKNDMCDTSKLSHLRGSPQHPKTLGSPLGCLHLKSLFIGIKEGGGTPIVGVQTGQMADRIDREHT
jgi:hypothetical protein